jgi:hypothetical protein
MKQEVDSDAALRSGDSLVPNAAVAVPDADLPSSR